MHICIFFDDVITPPFKTRRAIFLTQFFFDFRPQLSFLGVLLIFSIPGPQIRANEW